MIRDAELNDAGGIAGVIVDAWQTAYTGIVDPAYPLLLKKEKFVQIMLDNIVNRKEIIFVYEEDGAVLGFVSGRNASDGYDCEVVGLYVSPRRQKSGIGRLLLDAMKSRFRDEGRKNLIIWTLLGAGNNGFYLRQGGDLRERKILEIGGAEYQGAGFAFKL